MACMGIDLGTTKAVIAIVRNGEVVIVPDENANNVTPSYVAFTGRSVLVGEAARSLTTTNPSNTIFDTNYHIDLNEENAGLTTFDPRKTPFKVITDDGGNAKVQVDFNGEAMTFSPEEISALLLTKLKDNAENFIGAPITNAVIAVPSHYNNDQRRAVKEVGELAGLDEVEIINAQLPLRLLACCGNRNILVFDHGTRACNISIIKKSHREMKVLSSRVKNIGGEWFTNRLCYYLIDEFERMRKKDIFQKPTVLPRLRAASEDAKRTLSTSIQASIHLDNLYDGADCHTTITRACFEKLCAHLFSACTNDVKSFLGDVGISTSAVTDVILTGGSCRIPKIQEMILEHFADSEINKNVCFDEAIARGAAMRAPMLMGVTCESFNNVSLAEVANLSLEVQTFHGETLPIIELNDTIPSTTSISLTTDEPYLSEINFNVIERNGRRRNVLGEFKITGITLDEEKSQEVEVTFNLDAGGILYVSANNKSNGREEWCVMMTNERSPVGERKKQRIWALMQPSTILF